MSRDEAQQIRQARELLAESKAADSTDPARWWGRFEASMEMLLAYLDERKQ